MARSRAFSDATAVPSELGIDTPTQTFDEYIVVDGAQFNTVRVFHPRKGTVHYHSIR
jgi:hypothetical protein